MTEGLANIHGRANKRHTTLYKRWAEGGTGLLITGNAMVDHRFLERPGNVVLTAENGTEHLTDWAKAGQTNDTHIWTQISHPGRQCARIVSMTPQSPSEVKLDILNNFGKPKAMTEEDIQLAIQNYITAAKLSIESGFTGVQIHGAHGYLISQFLSPVTNKRDDQWGGSLENRARFLLEVVRGVREALGPKTPVAVKLNSADFQKGGFTLDESAKVAVWLADSGIDLLEISGGTYEHVSFVGGKGDDSTADAPQVEKRESTRKREAYFLEYAEVIQKALASCSLRVPLLVTGGFRSREMMEQAVAEMGIDMVGLARPLCIDPDFSNKLLSKDVDQLPDPVLTLGTGWFGPTSSSNSMRTLNSQAEVTWYYRQILRLSKGQMPKATVKASNALLTHFLREFNIGIRRRLFSKT
ncbi:NADH:flavin oxidoreductase [Veronia pacifica]|uniref:NADH:flavin oxidoreductase n=2 Tax=Veronia pacifica TaxID=1080227 RepID=A0A1C3ER45_9GAMM|nr:NADH:flavin oxidoreductase [Veronia pacifica]